MKIDEKSFGVDVPGQFASNVQICAFSYGTSQARVNAAKCGGCDHGDHSSGPWKFADRVCVAVSVAENVGLQRTD